MFNCYKCKEDFAVLFTGRCWDCYINSKKTSDMMMISLSPYKRAVVVDKEECEGLIIIYEESE
jgi:hypothetical protein